MKKYLYKLLSKCIKNRFLNRNSKYLKLYTPFTHKGIVFLWEGANEEDYQVIL